MFGAGWSDPLPYPHLTQMKASPATPELAGRSRADALVDEFVAEKRAEAEELLKVEGRRRHGRKILSIALGALATAAWTLPVGGPPAEGFVPPSGFTLASARMTIGLAATRIESYRATHGRLPSTLEEASVEVEELSYVQGGDGSFTLQLASDAGLLTHDSSVAPALMLEPAAQVIARTGR